MTMMRFFALFYLAFAVPTLADKGSGRDVRVVNQAGFKCDIFWINRWKNDELVKNSEEGVFHGSETYIKSFLSHEFEIVEIPAKKTGLCRGENNECRKGYFQVSEYHGQVVTFNTNLTTITHTDNKSRARDQAAEVLQECKAQHMAAGSFNVESMDQLMACIDNSVNVSLNKQSEEISFQETVRLKMGSKLVNYACVDPKMKQTKEMENKTWTFFQDKVEREVKVMMKRPSVQVHLMENFISEEECAAVEAAAKLGRVEGANGLWALKGGFDIPWATKDSLLTSLATKFYSYARDQLRLMDFDVEMAEQMFVLKYQGKGADSEAFDRYDPHCDGSCDGSPHVKGNRVATFIGYCEVPSVGGGTHFTNAGIHIVPKKFSAVYYSYLDPTTQTTDSGFTQHAGCPVIEGDKTIVTHKIRY